MAAAVDATGVEGRVVVVVLAVVVPEVGHPVTRRAAELRVECRGLECCRAPIGWVLPVAGVVGRRAHYAPDRLVVSAAYLLRPGTPPTKRVSKLCRVGVAIFVLLYREPRRRRPGVPPPVGGGGPPLSPVPPGAGRRPPGVPPVSGGRSGSPSGGGLPPTGGGPVSPGVRLRSGVCSRRFLRGPRSGKPGRVPKPANGASEKRSAPGCGTVSGLMSPGARPVPPAPPKIPRAGPAP